MLQNHEFLNLQWEISIIFSRALLFRYPTVDLFLVMDGEQDRRDTHDEEAHRDGAVEDLKEIPIIHIDEAHEVLFAHRTQNQGKEDGGEREFVFVHQPSYYAEEDADSDIEDVLVNGERAEQRDDEDDRIEHLLFHGDDFREEANTEAADQEHRKVGQHQGGKDFVHGRKLVDVHHGTWLDSLHDKGSQKNRRNGIPRDAEGEQGDHRPAGAAVVRGFRGGNSVRDPGTPFFRMPGEAFVKAVGDEYGDIAARAWDGPDEGSDDAAKKDVRPDRSNRFSVGKHPRDLLMGGFLFLLVIDDALHASDDFRHRKKPDQDRDEGKAGKKGAEVEDEALRPIGGILANRFN